MSSLTPDVINLFRKGDENASKIVHSYFYQQLCHFAKKLVPDVQEAEDIVTDAFLKLLENVKNVKNADHISAFLYKTVQNLCISALRHNKVQKKYNEEARFLHTPDEALIDREKATSRILREIDDQIQLLPEKCKQVFLMRYNDRLDFDEIARELKISESTARNNFAYARKLIRNNLRKRGIEGLLIMLWLFLMR
jgi:RNA polymerase sigma-70 factor (ECF subfamily)